MKDKMMFYGITIGKRHTNKQKQLFLTEVIKKCQELNLPTSFQTEHTKVSHTCSLVINDLKKADTIVACAYDTPTKAYFPIKYYPFNPALNTKMEGINLFIQLLICSLGLLAMYFLLKDFKLASTLWKVVRVLGCAILLFMDWRIMKGVANPINFNRNSASVVTLLQLAETIKKDNIAYVLLDNTCNSYEGLKLLAKEMNPNSKVILLDGIASGEKMVVAHRKGVNVESLLEEDWIKKEYNEDTQNMLALFNRALVLTSGSIQKGQFVIHNTRTRKDIKVDMPRLEHITEKLTTYLEEK